MIYYSRYIQVFYDNTLLLMLVVLLVIENVCFFLIYYLFIVHMLDLSRVFAFKI